MDKITKNSCKYIKVKPTGNDIYQWIVKYAIDPVTNDLYIMSVYDYKWDEEFFKCFKNITQSFI